MTKQYSISGVASDIQLGKRGGHLAFDTASGVFKLTGADGSTASRIKVADGVANDDAVSFGQMSTAISTAVGDATSALELQIGDLDGLATTEKSDIVSAINEVKEAIGDQIGELGTMASQDADDVAITGGSIAGVTLAVNTIAEHTADSGVTVDGVVLKDGSITAEDVVIQGNLTVLGDTVSLEVAELKVKDNTITLNDGETGAGVSAGTSGIEVDRGTADNATMVWDEATDKWVFKYATSGDLAKIAADFDFGDQLVGRENGGLGVDISDYAGSSLLQGDGSELVKGDEHQVLTAGEEGLSYEYVKQLRNAAGVSVVDVSEAESASGEYLEITNGEGSLTLTARNAAGTGDVDLYLQGQGNGDVIIAANSSNEGLIIGEDGTSLTISGGAGSAADAGNLMLKGGDGSGTYASGDVVLQGGTGGASEGIVLVRDSAGNLVASFTGGVEDAVDHIDFVNGVGEAQIKAAGESADVDLVLAPKGDGYVVAPVGYSTASAPANAFITKGEVSSLTTELANNIDPQFRKAAIVTNGTATEFNIGAALPVVAGKAYFVSRVVVRVEDDMDADYVVNVRAGSTVIAANAQLDTLEGTYIVEHAFAEEIAGGAQLKVVFGAAPTTGQKLQVFVEYKVAEATPA